MSSWKALNKTAKITKIVKIVKIARIGKIVNFAEEFNPGHK